MHLLKDRDEIMAAARAPYAAAWCVGAMPDDVAPADAVLWLMPTTLRDVIGAHQNTAIRYTDDYSEAAGQAAVLARAVRVDPDNWRLGDASEPPNPVGLQPLWTHWRQVQALGDGTSVHSTSNRLLTLLAEATGFAMPDELPEQERSFEAFLASARQRGRWVSGIFPGDPEAAVYIRPFTVAEQDAAAAACEYVVTDKSLHIPIMAVPHIVSAVVRSGPEDRQVMSTQDAEALPYGTAMTIQTMAYELTQGRMEDRLREVRFRRLASAVRDDARDDAAAPVVVGDVPASGAA
ncbi:MAG: hypothetical protein MOGMAGMI_02481 [Candidatus Omnitrophica bacterium]|nr:hypothetical protein [Candidatus Omnitrophota bacterium]